MMWMGWYGFAGWLRDYKGKTLAVAEDGVNFYAFCRV
jgi:hypothetical protein